MNEDTYEYPDEDKLTETEYDTAMGVMYEEAYEICEGFMEASVEFLSEKYKPTI